MSLTPIIYNNSRTCNCKTDVRVRHQKHLTCSSRTNEIAGGIIRINCRKPTWIIWDYHVQGIDGVWKLDGPVYTKSRENVVFEEKIARIQVTMEIAEAETLRKQTERTWKSLSIAGEKQIVLQASRCPLYTRIGDINSCTTRPKEVRVWCRWHCSTAA